MEKLALLQSNPWFPDYIPQRMRAAWPWKEQPSAIVLKLIFGYLNCRTSNIVLEYSTEGGHSLLGGGGGGGGIVEKIREVKARQFCSISRFEIILLEPRPPHFIHVEEMRALFGTLHEVGNSWMNSVVICKELAVTVFSLKTSKVYLSVPNATQTVVATGGLCWLRWFEILSTRIAIHEVNFGLCWFPLLKLIFYFSNRLWYKISIVNVSLYLFPLF